MYVLAVITESLCCSVMHNYIGTKAQVKPDHNNYTELGGWAEEGPKKLFHEETAFQNT